MKVDSCRIIRMVVVNHWFMRSVLLYKIDQIRTFFVINIRTLQASVSRDKVNTYNKSIIILIYFEVFVAT